tara:strand:- start:2649 stop:2897 length:249 start_codon:yes stop_codon:yes gene_type:complete
MINEQGEPVDSISELYQEYWTFHAKMIGLEHNPLEIAAILMAQSLSMYKTILDKEDYDKIVDNMSELRDKVKPLDENDQYYH